MKKPTLNPEAPRFLNNLIIRDTVAKSQGLTIAFDQLVKLQLFERCAPQAAFEYIVKQIADCDDGKPKFLASIEKALVQGETIDYPDPSWDSPFINQWLRLSPPLGDTDLRPLLYLSRDRTLPLASFDELSPEGQELLEALLSTTKHMPPLVEQLKSLGETEGERILSRLKRHIRSSQWERAMIDKALHVTKAFPNLGASLATILNEMPATQRQAPLIPLLKNEPWAQNLLQRWSEDKSTPETVQKAIKVLERKA